MHITFPEANPRFCLIPASSQYGMYWIQIEGLQFLDQSYFTPANMPSQPNMSSTFPSPSSNCNVDWWKLISSPDSFRVDYIQTFYYYICRILRTIRAKGIRGWNRIQPNIHFTLKVELYNTINIITSFASIVEIQSECNEILSELKRGW